jgi:hypothetical protein
MSVEKIELKHLPEFAFLNGAQVKIDWVETASGWEYDMGEKVNKFAKINNPDRPLDLLVGEQRFKINGECVIKCNASENISFAFSIVGYNGTTVECINNSDF